MSSNTRGRRRNNNGGRGNGAMAVDSPNGAAQSGQQPNTAAVELRNWEGGTAQDVVSFVERKARVKLLNPRPNGGLITAQVGANDVAALQKANGIRFAGANLNIKVSKSNTSTALQVLTDLLETRYDPRLEMLNFSMLLSDPVLQSHGMLDNATTATKMFQALAKLASTKTSGKVQSVTLEGNNLVNGEIPLHLAAAFPSLQNLSLANNQIPDIQSLEALRNRLPMLRELVLAGNPVQQQPNYQAQIQEIMGMFRRLMVLDGVTVRSENELPPFALPAPITPTFFEDEIVGSMTPMFLSNFFGLWDSNRQGLLALYDDMSLFSLCFNANTPHLPAQKRAPNSYIDMSRNLMRLHNQKRNTRISVGPSSIGSAFNRIPGSKHDLTNVDAFAIDSWKLNNVRTPGDTAIIMVVHGEFIETGSNAKRSFDRTLVVLPGVNNSYIVASDMLTIRLHSALPKPGSGPGAINAQPQASQQIPPMQVPGQQQPQQPMGTAGVSPGMPATGMPSTGMPATGVPATGIPAAGVPSAGIPAPVQPNMDPAAVVQEVMQRTHLKAEYADMCARQSNYQLDAALQLFEQFRAQLPPDAFA